MKNTLLLGNGINYALLGSKKAQGWSDLYKGIKRRNISNNTLLYETCLIKSGKDDNSFKKSILTKLKDLSKPEIIKDINCEHICDLDSLLKTHNISDLITTNVDAVIESILKEKNGFKPVGEKWTTEDIYSIRRKMEFKKDDYSINLWKIHGDANDEKTVSLGFDQYCGSLSKIDAYVKGNYYSDPDVFFNKPIKEMIKDKDSFEGISWIELFFSTNVYMACFGLDYAEIDIWWILNKRYRFIKEGIPIKNKIVYLYNAHDYGNNQSDAKRQPLMRKNTFLISLVLNAKK